jgi:hypothetical protein
MKYTVRLNLFLNYLVDISEHQDKQWMKIHFS